MFRPFFDAFPVWDRPVGPVPPYRFGGTASELAEEAKVAFAESVDVGDVAGVHGESFDAESEGPVGDLFAVDADGGTPGQTSSWSWLWMRTFWR